MGKQPLVLCQQAAVRTQPWIPQTARTTTTAQYNSITPALDSLRLRTQTYYNSS